MGSCFAKWTCDYAEAQIGKPCGKTNEWSEAMDRIHYYNTPKNGEADSCSIFVDACVLMGGCVDPSYDEDPESAKYTAQYMLNEPQSAGANEGAGCAQAVSYFQAMGEWYTKTSEYERGDKYFLRRNSAVSSRNPLGVYHTGIIIGWDDNGFRCVEGNTNGGMVAEKFYSYSDAENRWAGVGRPRYDGWEPENTHDDDTEPAPVPQPDPTPAPDPDKPSEPIGTYKVVNVSSFLNVREAPSKNSKSIWKLLNGDKVPIYEIQDGWGRIDDYGWVSMDYLAKL